MVIYDLDGGTGDFPDQTADITELNTTYSHVPEKEGYIFDCWEIVYANDDTYAMNYRLTPDSLFPDSCDMVLRALWLKVRVTVKNLPENGVVNRATTTSLQLDVDVYPTASDFSPTWSMPESRAMTRATSTGSDYSVTTSWESSDESIATVDENGTIFFISSGIIFLTTYMVCRKAGKSASKFVKIPIYVYKLEENSSVFTLDTKIPEEVRGMALEKMNAYYNDNPDIKAVVDGTDPDCNTCIFAFEGLGEGFGDTSTYHTNSYKFLSAMMVVTKGKEVVYATRRASTLPDLRPTRKDADVSFTTPKEGIFNYKTGYHGNPYYNAKTNSGENKTDGYLALVPNLAYNDSWVGIYKDNEVGFYCNSCSGINIHATGYTPIPDSDDVKILKKAHSRGCQTVSITEYIEFGKKVGFIKEDFFGTPNTNGYSSSLNTMLAPIHSKHNYIEVKYILDRSEDRKNTDYISTGTFYPITHTCNNLCLA